MPSASKVARSHASNFFLCAAPILIAGWPGMLASSADVRRKPHPFHFGCRADRARLRKIASTFAGKPPSASENHFRNSARFG